MVQIDSFVRRTVIQAACPLRDRGTLGDLKITKAKAGGAIFNVVFKVIGTLRCHMHIREGSRYYGICH